MELITIKIVSINALPYGSTGNIMMQISDIARKQGNECYTFSKSIQNYQIKSEYSQFHTNIGTVKSINRNARFSIYSGMDGIYAFNSTRKLLQTIDKIKPDIIHLHNLHGWFVNLPMLFKYIVKNNIKVVWTLHDCWAFTGHCPYFDMAKCDKWIDGCRKCEQYREYPQSKIDMSGIMWKLKKKLFTSVPDMAIVTPSEWLKSLVQKSYLGKYPVNVINNGIDLNIFKPTRSDFRERYNLNGKFILLGVASDWGIRKGLDVLIKLANMSDDNFRIVIVGTNDDIDKMLPDNMISIHSTHNQQELAEIYSAADVFVNPTREENYPTVNMEAIACGTPVVTFNTGGSVEIPNDKSGFVVPKDDIDAMYESILNIYHNRPFSAENCLQRAKCFDKNISFKKYIDLYNKMCECK